MVYALYYLGSNFSFVFLISCVVLSELFYFFEFVFNTEMKVVLILWVVINEVRVWRAVKVF